MSTTEHSLDLTMQSTKSDLSFTILWSPLPLITWFIPFIGHTGIADSNGVASDFRGKLSSAHPFGRPTISCGLNSTYNAANVFLPRIVGPYFVGDDGKMAFGNPTRALKIDIGDLPGGADRWDQAIAEANSVYRERMHNICCDNCHSHVANALNRMPVKSPLGGNWGMVIICFYVFFRGSFLSRGGFFLQFGPFLLLSFMCWYFSS